MLQIISVLYNSLLGEVTKEDLMRALELMWKGMVGIFIVIVLIFAVILILNAVTKKRKRNQEENGKE